MSTKLFEKIGPCVAPKFPPKKATTNETDALALEKLSCWESLKVRSDRNDWPEVLKKGAAALRILDRASEKLSEQKAELTELHGYMDKTDDPHGWNRVHEKIKMIEEFEKMLRGNRERYGPSFLLCVVDL